MSIFASRRHFSQVEQDILLFLLRCLPEAVTTAVRIPVLQMSQRTGREYSLAALQTATLELGSRGLECTSPTGPRQYWLFDMCTFLIGKGTIELYLSTAGLTCLRELTEQYSVEQIRLLLSVSGKYTRRLLLLYFPLLAEATGSITYSLTELRVHLGLVDNGSEIFRQVGHLREKVLNPAIHQLRQIAGYKFTCELSKEGGRYVAVRLQAASITTNLAVVPGLTGINPLNTSR